MIRATTFCFLAGAGLAQAQGGFKTPSGQPLELFYMDVVQQEKQGGLLYIGLLAPEIARTDKTYDFQDAVPDFDWICEILALPEAQKRTSAGNLVATVVIRLTNRPLMWGETDRQAKQFMASYDLGNGECNWQ